MTGPETAEELRQLAVEHPSDAAEKLPEIIEHLHAEDAQTVTETLLTREPAADAFRKVAMADPDRAVAAAADALVVARAEQTRDVSRTEDVYQLTDRSVDVLRQLMQALTDVAEQGTEWLTEVEAGPEFVAELAAGGVVREQALTVFHQAARDHPEAVAPYVDVARSGLRAPTDDVRNASLRFLRNLSNTDRYLPVAIVELPRLLSLLANESDTTRWWAVAVIGNACQSRAVDGSLAARLSRYLDDADTQVQAKLLWTLKRLAAHEPAAVGREFDAITSVIEETSDANIIEAGLAATAKCIDTTPDGLEKLEDLEAYADHDDPGVTIAAMRVALAASEVDPDGVADTVEPIVENLNRKEDRVVDVASATLLDLGQHQSTLVVEYAERLAEYLEILDGGARRNVGVLLGHLLENANGVGHLYHHENVRRFISSVTGPESAESVVEELPDTDSIFDRIEDEYEEATRHLDALPLLAMGRPDEVDDRFEHLLGLGDHEDLEVRSHALHALAALSLNRPDRLEVTLRELGRFVTDREEDIAGRPAILSTYGDAIRTLGEYPDAVTAHLDSHSPEIETFLQREGSRRLAAAILAASEDEPLVLEPFLDQLIPYLSEENSHLKGGVLEGVADLASSLPDAIEPHLGAILAEASNEGDKSGRYQALAATGAVASEQPADARQHVAAITEYLDDPAWEVRDVALTVLGEFAPDEIDALDGTFDDIARRLSDTVPEVRQSAALVLAGIAAGHPDRIAPYTSRVAEFLDSTDDTESLGYALITLLTVGLSDPEPVVTATEAEQLYDIVTSGASPEQAGDASTDDEEVAEIALAVLALHRDHADGQIPESVREGIDDADYSIPDDPASVVPEDVLIESDSTTSAPESDADEAADAVATADYGAEGEQVDGGDSSVSDGNAEADRASAAQPGPADSDETRPLIELEGTAIEMDHPAVRIQEWDEDDNPKPAFDIATALDELRGDDSERRLQAAGILLHAAVAVEADFEPETTRELLTILEDGAFEIDTERLVLNALANGSPAQPLTEKADVLLSSLGHERERIRMASYHVTHRLMLEDEEFVEPYAEDLASSLEMEDDPLEWGRMLRIVAILRPKLYREYDLLTGPVPDELAADLFRLLGAASSETPEIAVAIFDSVVATLDTTQQLPEQATIAGLELLTSACYTAEELSVSDDLIHRYLAADDRRVQQPAAAAVAASSGDGFDMEQSLQRLIELLDVDRQSLPEETDKLPELAAEAVAATVTGEGVVEPADGASQALRHHGQIVAAFPELERRGQLSLLRVLIAFARLHPPTLAQHIEFMVEQLDSAPPKVAHYVLQFVFQTARHRPVITDYLDEIAGVLPDGLDSDNDSVVVALGILGVTARSHESEPVADQTESVVTVLTNYDGDRRTRASQVLSDITTDHPAVVDGHTPEIVSTFGPDIDEDARNYLGLTLSRIADGDPDTHETLAENIGELLSEFDRFEPEAQSRILGILEKLADHPEKVATQLEHVEDALEHEDPSVREKAIRVVWRLAQESPEQVLGSLDETAALLSASEHEIQLHAVYVFVEVATDYPLAEEYVDRLAALLDSDEDTAIRRWAATALANSAGENPDSISAHVPALTARFGDQAETAKQATRAVRRVVDDGVAVALDSAAVGELVSAHENEDLLYERTALLATLAGTDPVLLTGHREVLRTRIRSGDRRTSQRALEALRHVGSKPELGSRQI
jgi:hypothetical protein